MVRQYPNTLKTSKKMLKTLSSILCSLLWNFSFMPECLLDAKILLWIPHWIHIILISTLNQILLRICWEGCKDNLVQNISIIMYLEAKISLPYHLHKSVTPPYINKFLRSCLLSKSAACKIFPSCIINFSSVK